MFARKASFRRKHLLDIAVPLNASPDDFEKQEEFSLKVENGVCDVGEMARKIIGLVDQSVDIGNIMFAKQPLLHRLFREQLNVSEKLMQYFQIREHLGGNPEDLIFLQNQGPLERLSSIDSEVEDCVSLMLDFLRRLERAGKIVRDFLRHIGSHTSALLHCLEVVKQAQKFGGRNQVELPSLPTFNWVRRVLDPQIEKLVDKWEELHLQHRVTHLVHELELFSTSEVTSSRKAIETPRNGSSCSGKFRRSLGTSSLLAPAQCRSELYDKCVSLPDLI